MTNDDLDGLPVLSKEDKRKARAEAEAEYQAMTPEEHAAEDAAHEAMNSDSDEEPEPEEGVTPLSEPDENGTRWRRLRM